MRHFSDLYKADSTRARLPRGRGRRRGSRLAAAGQSSWFLAFVGFALLVILHELGHFAAAKAVGHAGRAVLAVLPADAGAKKVGETEYAIGAIPAGGYVKITGMNPAEDLPDEVRTRAYYSQPVWKRIVVIAAGPAVNLLLAFILLFVFFFADRPGDRHRPRSADGEGLSGRERAPAGRPAGGRGRQARRRRGLLEADRRAQVRRASPTEGCKATTPVTVTVERDGGSGRSSSRRSTTRRTESEHEETGRTRLGFAYQTGPRDPLPFGESVEIAADRFWFVTKETLELPARLIDSEQRKEISGVVGSYETTRQTILDDLADVVLILAIISLSLAIVNLFPFLPLDGGHIFWAIVEKIRGKPVPFSVMERAGVVGFMLVILIFLVGLSNDIDRLSGEGFRSVGASRVPHMEVTDRTAGPTRPAGLDASTVAEAFQLTAAANPDRPAIRTKDDGSRSPGASTPRG